ncbi:stage III sporulation protein AF [Bacillus sp. S/N-304-OC-R1]|uniref:stage III sporulation protein AF n=1 Tax=Bacillus sp. S/N-304-OC-R1 TaxID=2758034 RepID=UPI001C8DE831|nr:stage III sporulation protein AF [Bacillus sp. S/N-304-OC-R1]MBY0122436.1 stage III sporulation protein AF [Bacillus sp. S/N-304-OC-R1]
MEFIKEWITNIILFILLATVIDMLLPNSNLQKYTKMVTGLLLIAVILTPVFKLISHDFEEVLASIPVLKGTGEKNLENSIEMKKREIQAWQDAYILDEMAVQLEKQAEEELMEQYQLEFMHVDLQVDANDPNTFPDNLKKVEVQLRPKGAKPEVVEVVKKIEINTQESLPSNRSTNETEKIVSLLAEKWNVNEEKIVVRVEGGK